MLKLNCIASFIKKIIASISLLLAVLNLSAQSAADSFFNSQSSLRIALTVSLKEIEATRNDSLYLKQKLFYKSGNYLDNYSFEKITSDNEEETDGEAENEIERRRNEDRHVGKNLM